MPSDLTLRVDDLAGHPERTRPFSGITQVSLRVGEARVRGPALVTGIAFGTVDGVHTRFLVTADAGLVCVRCLDEWDERITVEADQHYSKHPDEDGYAIVDRQIDLSGPATDELALGIPAAPVCRPACKGLCPICGTDLNNDPCDGHLDYSDSPFAALRDLFDP